MTRKGYELADDLIIMTRKWNVEQRTSFLAALLNTRSSSVRIMMIVGVVWHARENAHAEGWKSGKEYWHVGGRWAWRASESTHGDVATDRWQGCARG